MNDTLILAAHAVLRTIDAGGEDGKVFSRDNCIKRLRDALAEAERPRDPDDDERDGVLFRFWIRAASYPGGWPIRLVQLFHEHVPKDGENMQPRHYRAALMALAKEKGVNLP